MIILCSWVPLIGQRASREFQGDGNSLSDHTPGRRGCGAGAPVNVKDALVVLGTGIHGGGGK